MRVGVLMDISWGIFFSILIATFIGQIGIYLFNELIKPKLDSARDHIKEKIRMEDHKMSTNVKHYRIEKATNGGYILDVEISAPAFMKKAEYSTLVFTDIGKLLEHIKKELS